MERALRGALGAATRKILHPLVRILLRAGVPCAVLVEQVKRVYVEVARSEFNVGRRKPSISRTAVITGLTRKEVSRLWKAGVDAAEPAVYKYNRAVRVISGWVRDERFANARGAPASLPFQVETPATAASFSALVARYSGDMPPRAVLDELLRVGAVEELRNGKFRLVKRAYVPAKGAEEKLGILGDDVAELLTTIDHNLTCMPEDALYQRKVLYDNLPVECLADLRASAGAASQALLEKFDRQMSQLDRDATPSAGGTGRVTASVGVYFYESTSADESGEG